MNREALEIWALRLLSNGGGMWPIPDNEYADEAYVGWPVESPDRPVVIFRKGGSAKETVEFKLVALPAAERTDYSKALAEVANAGQRPPRLVGVRFWKHEGDRPEVRGEFRLDPANSSNVVIVVGKGQDWAEDLMARGVALVPVTIRHAALIGKEEGVTMPAPKGEDDEIVLKPRDGLKFIVALLAMYERDNGYEWGERVRE